MGTKKQPDTSHDTAPGTAHTGLADALFSTTPQRELVRLAHSGLVTQQTIGRQKHYQANSSAPIFGEMCAIASKTMSLAKPLRKALAPLAPQIHAAFVYGSVAKRQDTANSDVDLMVVSDELTYADLFTLPEDVSQTLGREVKPTIYSRRQWAARLARGDSFLTRVQAQPRIWLIGDANAIAAS